MGKLAAGLVVVCISAIAYGGSVSLVGEGFDPNSGQEVTVYVQTDTPLWGILMEVTVAGDATVTAAMDWADCNDYGWDAGWADTAIYPDGTIDTAALRFAGDANGIIGYFTFTYHSGQVEVSLTGDAFDAQWNRVLFSTGTLTFGQPDSLRGPDPNMSSVAEASSFGIEEEWQAESSPSGVGIPSDVNELIAISSNGELENPPSQGSLNDRINPQYERTIVDANSLRVHSGRSGDMETSQFLTDDRARDIWLAGMAGELSITGRYSTMTDSYIVYDSNTILTENTVWDRDVVLEGTVFVDGCMLAIMPGVTVYVSPQLQGIVVRNGGALIADGTNENWISFVTSPAETFYFAVKVESSASPATSISYCYIEWAYVGIWLDNCRLERPLSRLSLWSCYVGIGEMGPALTDIFNNEIINARATAIEIFMADPCDPNAVYSADSHIAMEHNSIIGWWRDGWQGQDFGVTVHGSMDPNAVGGMIMANNIIAGSYWFAVYLPDGLVMTGGDYNNGYYLNEFIDVCEYETGLPWHEVNPHYAQWWDCPFVNGYHSWPYYPIPDSNFVDGGAMTVEEAGYLIGQSTYFGVPDVDVADIGFHYDFEPYVNAGVNPLRADFNNDLGVDANDLLIFTNHWLEDGNSPTYDPNTNFDDEDLIDLRDFAILASEWKTRTGPIPPDIAPTFDQDPNNLKGVVSL